MGLSKKTHSKKTDQETQSPVIKVFKDIMQLSENANNPEKANLLKEKRDKKKKRCFGQKPQHEVKSGDTSASERHGKPTHQHSHSQPKSQSVFHSEKRDSWWTWGDAEKNQEDTCSCVSCALKKLVTQRSGLMSCLATFLAISGVIAIYLVISTMPKTCIEKNNLNLPRNEQVAKTAKPEGDKRERRSEINMNGKGMQDRSIWDESKSRLMNSLSDLYSADFGENNLHDGGNLQESSGGVKTELSSVLDPNKLSEGYDGSSRLRNFYKKLIQTDMQIKNLKKSIREARPFADEFPDLGLSRAKRSLKFFPSRHPRALNLTAADHQSFRDLHLYFPPAPVIHVRAPKEQKVKRYVNESGPSGFVIENKKLVVKYKQYPKRHKLPNRSHAHIVMENLPENEPLHPVFKDTEQLDEILTRLIEKNVPDAIFDPFGLRTVTPLLSTGKYSLADDYPLADQRFHAKPNSKKNKMAFKMKPSTMKTKTYEATEGRQFQHTTVDNFGEVVSVSTILNSEAKKSLDLISRVPNIRKLMQVEVDEDNDGMVGSDEEGNREKRMGASESDMQIGGKYNPPDIHNPNWKGPMPLYPDELNSIIKQAAMQNIRKVEVPINKDNVAGNEKDISDTEYVEDYVNNKYDKLVKMAQAYSDYGVLEDKKDMRVEKNNKALENRVKLSVQKGFGLFDRLKKSKSDAAIDPEGIRFEYKSKSTVPKDSKEHVSGSDFFKFGSHLKVTSNSKQPQSEGESNSFKSYGFLYTNADKEKTQKYPKESTDVSSGDDVYFSRHKRALMSVNEDVTAKELTEVDNDAQSDDSNMETLGSTSKPDTVSSSYFSPYAVVHTTSSISDLPKIVTEKSSSKNEASTEPSGLEYTDVSESTTTEFIKAMLLNKNIDSNAKSNNTDMKPGEIFELIIDWFKILSGLEMDEDHANDTRMVMDFLSVMKPEKLPIIPLNYYITDSVKTTTQTPMYPIFDSEMVENIGHRSRVLMSVEEKLDNATVNEDKKDIQKISGAQITDKEPANATSTEINEITNASNVYENVGDNLANPATTESKTVKKRSATDNSNLIFWNDMYDDEYGVKDPLENAVRDKHSVKFNDVISKSENWFGMKLKKISDSVRNSRKVNGKVNKQRIDPRGKREKISKRDTLFEDSDKQNFAALTANMKKVCREAAQAVHETKNMEAPLKVAEGEAASSLMQQLVSLMADLVEIQVQQKTCVPLPSDLRSFLVWLTSPNPEENNPQMQNFDELASHVVTGQTTENFPDTSSSDMYPYDVRTECLGTIHDVQDLIHLYDEMSEEDKSKMSGVREYLENQLDFLHKQLSTFDGNKDVSINPIQSIRKKRQSAQKRSRITRRLHRFLKNFGKKRTRSTVSFDTLEPFTDNRKSSKNDNNAIGYTHRNDIKEVKENEDIDKTKRNLPDIYYRALADAKNATTTRNVSIRT